MSFPVLEFGDVGVPDDWEIYVDWQERREEAASWMVPRGSIIRTWDAILIHRSRPGLISLRVRLEPRSPTESTIGVWIRDRLGNTGNVTAYDQYSRHPPEEAERWMWTILRRWHLTDEMIMTHLL